MPRSPGCPGVATRGSSSPPPPTCRALCQHPRPCAHARLPRAGSGSLPRADGIQISRGCPWPPLHSRRLKKGPSVRAGGRGRGASISAHISLGPKKNPQAVAPPLSHTRLSHIPSLPEPALGGPSKPASTPPSPPARDPGPALVGPPAGTSEGPRPGPEAAGNHGGASGGASLPRPPLTYGGGSGGKAGAGSRPWGLAAAGSPSSQPACTLRGSPRASRKGHSPLPTSQSRLGLPRSSFLGGSMFLG